jgi:PTS system nitrogen regulatory IIA component
MSLFGLLDRHSINGHVSVNSKRQALQAVAEHAAKLFKMDADVIFNALVDREKQGSTGVGLGVAVPHAALAGLTQMRGIFLRLETPIDYDSIDHVPVDLVFALFAPPEAGSEHLRALAKVSRALRQKSMREQLRALDTNDALYALLADSGGNTHAA